MILNKILWSFGHGVLFFYLSPNKFRSVKKIIPHHFVEEDFIEVGGGLKLFFHIFSHCITGYAI